jgi:electron transport complex protein RnfE
VSPDARQGFNEEIVKGLWRENPVFVQVLGMCPTLAVSNSAVNALAMASATLFVLVGSSTIISLLRKVIPSQVRISTYIAIIATFVTVADMTLQAVALSVHRELGAFIALIVVNCIILGRAEAYANKNPVKQSVADAIGMGLGFGLALFCLGSVREILGNGTFFGISVFGPRFEPWVIMILPPGGFLTLGLYLLVFAAVREHRQRRSARPARRAA